MQLGHDDLGSANALFVHADRNAAAVVDDRDRTFRVNRDGHPVAVARQVLVDSVVDHLPNEVVKAGAIVRIADVHTRALANRLEPFEHLNGALIVAGSGRARFRGRGVSHRAF